MTAERQGGNRQDAGSPTLARWIVRLLVAFFVSAAVVGILDQMRPDGSRAPREFAALTAASTIQGFEHAVFDHSATRLKSDLRPPENITIWPLRVQMFVDSLVLEPAYGGLLVMYMLALRRLVHAPSARKWDWALQVGCLFVACGVMLDIAENGMAVRAAEDALHRLLAQGTVDDVHLATRLKWGFIGAASLVVGIFGLRVPDESWLVSSRWLRRGSMAALLVGPLAAAQCMVGIFDATTRDLLGLPLVIAFAFALSAIGLVLRNQMRASTRRARG